MCSIYKYIRKWVYRKSLHKVNIISKYSREFYKKIEPYKIIKLDTTHGEFKFIFKRDLRQSYKREIPGIHSYVVELESPKELSSLETPIESSYLIVVRIAFIKPDEDILAEVLMDTYIRKMFNHIKYRRK